MPTKRAVYDVAEFKALSSDGEEKGKFEAMVSVFGNVDIQGDRVMEGAFQKSLESWKASGSPLPIIWSHSWADPNAHIGSADPADVVEVKGRGLQVGGTIDLDNPFAAQVYRLLKERRVREFSFGYEVVKERRGKDGANELVELRIIEAGPTLKGANPNTELLAIKSQLEEAADQATEIAEEYTSGDGTTRVVMKAGRSISSKNEARIRTAVESLTQVLASLGDADEKTPATDTDEAKADPADEPKAFDRERLELQALLVKVGK